MGRGKNEEFHLSGPYHLTKVDWENADHRRIVAASLVQAVYVVERDRQKKRKPSEARAAAWSQFFHFQEKECLIDRDNSIFGVIYEFKPLSAADAAPPNAPVKYVIAFRGTFLHRHSIFRDMKHNIHLFFTSLNRAYRFRTAIEAVEKAVSEAGHSNIWLAGHSLGASLGTLVGKSMARKGYFLKSFLFNPPILSLPIIHVGINKEVKMWIHFIHCIFTAQLSQWVQSIECKPGAKEEDMVSFASFSPWVPYLFVNRADCICQGYVEYFKKRAMMEEIGAKNIESVTTQTSIRASIGKVFGREVETVPILPSADLMLHGNPSSYSIKAHKLQQWWQPSLPQLECREYRYNWEGSSSSTSHLL